MMSRNDLIKIIIVIVMALVAVTFIFLYAQRVKKDIELIILEGAEARIEAMRPFLLEIRYKQALLEFKRKYCPGFELEKNCQAAEFEKEALKLKVPEKFKDLHLDLVVALSRVEEGKIPEAQGKISELIKNYPWLE
jgi:hypothetical protein